MQDTLCFDMCNHLVETHFDIVYAVLWGPCVCTGLVDYPPHEENRTPVFRNMEPSHPALIVHDPSAITPSYTVCSALPITREFGTSLPLSRLRCTNQGPVTEDVARSGTELQRGVGVTGPGRGKKPVARPATIPVDTASTAAICSTCRSSFCRIARPTMTSPWRSRSS